MTIKLSSLAVSPSCVPVPDMADSDRIVDFDWELQSMRGTFSQLLFADDLVGLEVESSSSETTNLGSNASYLSPYSKQDLPKMLSFGNHGEGNGAKAVPAASAGRRTDPKKSTSSCSAGISPKYLPKCKRREEEPMQSSSSIVSTSPIKNRKGSKRSKIENAPPASNNQTKARRLGERVAALQQLVSPYGKTDTASVLHEAMGYIRFLHEQVRVLCSPYLQQFPSPPDPHEGQGNGSEESISRERERSLRSRGLCLVPVACTIPVAACNGADFWSPAMCNGKLSSSSPSPPCHR